VTKKIGFIALAAGLALLYLWQHAEVMELGYELVNLRMQKTQVLQRNKLLQMELAELKAPDRIERLARETLHMIPPERVEIVVPRAP